MSETDYLSLAAFNRLPLLEATDPKCRSIETAIGVPGFTGQVFETDDLETAKAYLTVPDLMPTGGIRHSGTTQPVVFVYFWRKQI